MSTAGGPAFPVVFEDSKSYYGMSLRDYFAGQALMGFCAHSGGFLGPGAYADAYRIADAMLAQRESQ